VDSAAGTPWHIAFLATAGFGAYYLLLRRRRFDFCTIAFLGACFYFLPGFVGFAGYAEGFLLRPVAILPGTYAIMCWVLLVLVFCAALVDLAERDHSAPSAMINESLRHMGTIATSAGVAGLLLTWTTVGSALLDPDKFALLALLNRWYLLWTTGAVLGLSITFLRRSWFLFAVNALLLLANLYVGFRVDLVIAVLALCTIVMARRGPVRFISYWRTGLLIAAFGVLLFVYKYILFALKALDTDLLISQLSNPDAFKLIFLYSEPFVAQGTLNEVIRQGFFVGADHLQSVFLLFVPFANELGAEVVGFNDLFQPTLFSSVTEYGLGSNIWAEMWAVGGWAAIVLFSAVFAAVLVSSSIMARRLGPEGTALLVTLAVYWSFYIHRNDLLYQLTLSRRVLMAWALFALCALAIDKLLRRVKLIVDREYSSVERYG
jgi:hypothetical protein